MTLQRVAAVARAILYEGYILYPYRPSSLKNQQRWTFGGVFPRDHAAAGGSDPDVMQTQCLVSGTPDTRLTVRLRFLHLIARQPGRLRAPRGATLDLADASITPLPSLSVAGQTYVAWDEAVEREVVVPTVSVAGLLANPVRVPFAFAASRDIEPLAEEGHVAAVLVRAGMALEGAVEISAAPAQEGVYRITARIENHTPMPEAERRDRNQAQRYAFSSTHTVLQVEGGAFVSLLDPPNHLRAAAAACDNQGTWPVLAGEDGAADVLLSSPIILYDYPQIAPESPGDLFDGTEIDEILTLRILTMTDEEKREMAATDPRARSLLERTEALTAADLEALHGSLRRPGALRALDTKPRLASISSNGLRVAVGDQVRLHPKGRADIMDIVLDGMVAIVEGIERDFEDRVHVAVTIADDPGREFGMDRFPGHRFFFAADELEPIPAGAAS